MFVCNVMYKNFICFINFREGKGEVFEYFFGFSLDVFFFSQIDGINIWGKFVNKYLEDFFFEIFVCFVNLNIYFVEYNRLIRNKDNKILNFNFDWDIVYYIDVELFGQYFKEKIVLFNGVKYIQGKVIGYQKEFLNNYNFKYIILD